MSEINKTEEELALQMQAMKKQMADLAEAKKLAAQKDKELQKEQIAKERLIEHKKRLSQFKDVIEEGLPITYGDNKMRVYQTSDKDSFQYLGAKVSGEVAFFGADRENKLVHDCIVPKLIRAKADDEVLETMPLTKQDSYDWRTALEQIPFANVSFDIKKDFEYVVEGVSHFNMYVPPEYLKLADGVGDPTDFILLTEHLFPVKEEREHVMSFVRQAVIGRCESKQLYLVGDQGVGKGVFYDVIKNLFAPEVVKKGSPKLLDKQFKPDLSRLRLLYIDEFVMKEGSNSRAESRAISESEVSIEQKYYDEKTVVSNTSFIFSSNETSKLSFAPTERRPLVPTLAREYLEDVFPDAWIEDLKDRAENDDTFKKAIYDYLMKFPKLTRRKIHTRYFEVISLASAPKLPGALLHMALSGQFSNRPPGVYEFEKFKPRKGLGRGTNNIKSSTASAWLSNFLWLGENLFKYDPGRPFYIEWLGISDQVVADYRKSLAASLDSADSDIDEDEL